MQPLLASLVSAAARHGLGAVALSLSLVATVAPQAANAQGLPDFTELVDKVGPAVVNIRTTERPRAGRGPGGSEMDEDMLEFFRRFGIPAPTGGIRARRSRTATPSRGAWAPASSPTPTATS
jgi:serine protease Do